MTLLIKSARVIDKQSEWHQQTVDIFIQDGIINKIGSSLNKKAAAEIHQHNLHISRGWFDSSVSFGEPGYEERETLENGLLTAAKSGFTDICLNPVSLPVIDNKSAVLALISAASGQPVNLKPTGSLTVKSEGRDLAEMYDMQKAGAASFGDYKKAIKNPNLLKLALQYAQNFDALVHSFPQENKIAGNGQVNEHHHSTSLGLKGIPNLAEELQISRDLYILEYTGGKLHIPTISTAGSVKLIEKAKKKGLDVTCSVAIHNLIFTDELLKDFDTNAKVLPPLRVESDLMALREGLQNGIIDMVTSDHYPLDIEHKKVEFDNAAYGSIGLESAFGALSKIFSTEEAIKFLTAGKSRFGMEDITIKEGQKARLSLFLPEEEYTFSDQNIYSTSQNSIFLGAKLAGKAFGIVAGENYITQ